MPRMSYALKAAGSSTLAMLAAAVLGLLCLQGLAAASPDRPTRPFVVVNRYSQDQLHVFKADPRTLARISPELSLAVVPEPATRARFPGTWAISRDRRLLAVSVERELSRMELEVIDLGTMKLLRSLRTDVQPIVWPAPDRLVGSRGDVFVALDPTTGVVSEHAPNPHAVYGPRSLVPTGLMGGPMRVLRLDAPDHFRTVTFERMRYGLESFVAGGGRLPPLAKDAVARARGAAAKDGVAGDLIAVAPLVSGNTAMGCGAGGQSITSGYRVLFSGADGQAEYRVPIDRGSAGLPIRCDESHAGPFRPETNLLTAPRPTWYVREAGIAAVGRDGTVVVSGTVVAQHSLRQRRVRYRLVDEDLSFLGETAWVGGSTVATSESDGVFLIDTKTGRTRSLGDGGLIAAGGGTIVVTGSEEPGGLSVYDSTGRVRHRALRGRQVGELQRYGDYVYVRLNGDLQARRVVSLLTGRVLARVPDPGTELLLPKPS